MLFLSLFYEENILVVRGFDSKPKHWVCSLPFLTQTLNSGCMGCVLTLCMLLQGVTEMMEEQRHLMQSVLDDTQLNRLRLEGGTVLARFRKEEASNNDRYMRVTLMGPQQKITYTT